MTYEDVKNKRATAEKSGNVQKAPTQPPVPPPPPPPLGATATWSTERAPPGQKDAKRVHFNLETLNSRRLLTHPGPGEEPVAGGPPPPAPVREAELEELQERIERFRAQLREALARRAELQTSLAKQRADPPTATDGPSPGPAPIANTAPSADSSETRTASEGLPELESRTALRLVWWPGRHDNGSVAQLRRDQVGGVCPLQKVMLPPRGRYLGLLPARYLPGDCDLWWLGHSDWLFRVQQSGKFQRVGDLRWLWLSTSPWR
ncbi:hypothetical protein SKAU_G00319380 [Synaphobranchus kaupii]|uniref:Uncharacterized protein n=1 Tax=Synaphobranchus kaupii TaxID=118154 RepID=A0A9Q1ENK3_SYNKA|nr:hypothetical protein SKAU_G00319380 [Synaphobranchus kaupii]